MSLGISVSPFPGNASFSVGSLIVAFLMEAAPGLLPTQLVTAVEEQLLQAAKIPGLSLNQDGFGHR